MRRLSFLLFILLFVYAKATAQSTKTQLVKTLDVANGLPQSVVNGIVQDSVGFIWIGTRDGLARYDGKKCKVFRHIPGDSTSMSSNTIAELYMGSENRLWILYETGDIDIINTLTEAIMHLTKLKTFHALLKTVKVGHTITEDSNGNAWLLGEAGLFICNAGKQQLDFYTYASLNLSNEKVASIIYSNGKIVFVSDLSLTTVNENRQVIQKIKYPLPGKNSTNTTAVFTNYYAVSRPNGDAVIQYKNEILVYTAADKSFLTIPLNETDLSSNSMVMDDAGNIYIFYTSNIYQLSAENKLTLWRSKELNPKLGFLSMFFDRSGVLWLGSNGDGVQLFDLRLSRLQGIAYEINFPKDIFKGYLDVSSEKINAVFSNLNNAFTFRWARKNNGDIIFTETNNDATKTPQVFFYQNKNIIIPQWHYNDTSAVNHTSIYALACSRAGKIWGINFFMQPVYFDAVSNTVTVFKSIINLNTTGVLITDLLMDGEDKFWITTSFDGLYFYNKHTGKVIHYIYSEKPGALPTNQLIHIVQDAADSSILWISSLGAGIIKFDKNTGKCKFFTDRDGLPDNTVYAMVPDNKGLFWCSSNKGIFSFDPKTNTVLQSFTSKDGLAGDEFNRFHFFKFQNGNIAFGGVNGYTVFNPLTVAKDLYEPPTGFTQIEINNVPVDYGQPSSPFKSAVNSLAEMRLPYDQNFLTFQFAAFEYNIPEKIKYRFILQNFDDHWVYAGNSNIATYTKLPPGHYTFAINATNTSGQWSKYIKTIAVIIEPPFWQTWWFTAIWLFAAAALIYLFVRYRVSKIRKEERQKIIFEQEALELKAQALRAQMNPHFIFNCLNSIKALIQEDEKQKAVTYLTTFSKLIRNQMNNAQKEVSLHEEIETCRLYTQLEALRFGAHIACEFKIDENIDTHSLMIPPLLLQPFIENAIWHGILPKQKGKVTIIVKQEAGTILCEIDDDGIGRQMAMRNKLAATNTYESKGMQLVKNRLNLYNTIGANEASIEVTDKKDSNNNAAGTLITIRFKQEL